MSNAEMLKEPAVTGTIEMKLEVVVIPVSDVDRAKRFYRDLGWRLDVDYTAAGDDYRVIQFTPPGSGCSVIFGKNVTTAAPGSAKGLHLIVSDIQAARDELRRRGVEIGEPFHDAGGIFHHAGAERLALLSQKAAVSGIFESIMEANPTEARGQGWVSTERKRLNCVLTAMSMSL